jgi:hypothetical protein
LFFITSVGTLPEQELLRRPPPSEIGTPAVTTTAVAEAPERSTPAMNQTARAEEQDVPAVGLPVEHVCDRLAYYGYQPVSTDTHHRLLARGRDRIVVPTMDGAVPGFALRVIESLRHDQLGAGWLTRSGPPIAPAPPTTPSALHASMQREAALWHAFVVEQPSILAVGTTIAGTETALRAATARWFELPDDELVLVTRIRPGREAQTVLKEHPAPETNTAVDALSALGFTIEDAHALVDRHRSELAGAH